MVIKAQIVRNAAGFPTSVVLTGKRNKLTVTYDRNEMIFNGRIQPEYLEVLELIYPFAEKAAPQEYTALPSVQADAEHTNSVVDLYTVPAGKKMLIIHWFWHMNNLANANPDTIFYMLSPNGLVSEQIFAAGWNLGGQGSHACMAGNIIQKWFPVGWRLRSWCDADAEAYVGFFGVEMDAK